MAFDLKASDLAKALGVSPGRVSQYVTEGKLRSGKEFRGELHARRYDLAACAVALGKRLDVAQALGNGRDTMHAIGQIVGGAVIDPDEPDADGIADQGVKRRYDAARTMEKEEKARRARLENEAEHGTMLIAAEVEVQMAAQLAQEIAQVENVLTRGAEVVASKLGVDFVEVRGLLREVWRDHRTRRANAAAERASAAQPSEAEKAVDF